MSAGVAWRGMVRHPQAGGIQLSRNCLRKERAKGLARLNSDKSAAEIRGQIFLRQTLEVQQPRWTR